jgi:sugar lactone lactonase YvrE
VPCTARIIAGHGEGSADGRAAQAQFTNPAGIAADAAGSIYVADAGNDTLRRIKPDGTVETVAGAVGQMASVDGTGKDARFSNSRALAIGPDGNIYVADVNGGRLRKVTSQGVVTTVAKDFGSPDGLAGLAVEHAGVIYVCDYLHFVVRKIERDGTVTLLAGQPGKSEIVNGPAKNARFDFPCGIAVAPDGSLYVVDRYAIRKIDTHGVVTTLAGKTTGGADDGRGKAASFSHPNAIAIDSRGTLYVTDTNSIRQISPSGVVRTLQTTTKQPLPLKYPDALTIDPQGRILVADLSENTVVLVELAR